ncbi:IS3 family transposase [Mesobacillus maritimus]
MRYNYWYNNERSKAKLARLSPVEYRIQSSQLAA